MLRSDEERLDLEELLEPVLAVLPTETRLLVAAERRRPDVLARIDRHLAGAQLARHALGALVAAGHPRGQPVQRVVRYLDRFVLGVVRDDREDRAEDLFLGD